LWEDKPVGGREGETEADFVDKLIPASIAILYGSEGLKFAFLSQCKGYVKILKV
jgi:hypothetical protein